ncbi:MAG TPA: hypothetical protein DIW30_08445 [Bacteroidales bacterium]|nr:hypothetical protein [Bacteroidales bacterium]
MPTKGENKNCPICGGTFVCTHGVFCQCAGIELSQTAKEYLRTHYEDCICRKCLQKIACEM